MPNGSFGSRQILSNLNICINSWDPFIIYLIVQKLDTSTRGDWEEHAFRFDPEELPKCGKTECLKLNFRRGTG